MIHVNLKCFHCGKHLMDKSFEINNHPSTKVVITYKGKKGALHLSSRYGSHNVHSEIDVPKGEIVRFFCPHCKSDIGSSRVCYECKAPMVTFESILGGYLRICSGGGAGNMGLSSRTWKQSSGHSMKSIPRFLRVGRDENEKINK